MTSRIKQKVCPECNTDAYLMINTWFNDGTTDCGGCGCNWEEHELKEKETNDIKTKKNRREDRYAI